MHMLNIDNFLLIACILQVWKGQGSRKWKHGQHDGFFVQLESPFLRKLWFIPSTSEKGQTLCRFSLSVAFPFNFSLFMCVLAFLSIRKALVILNKGTGTIDG